MRHGWAARSPAIARRAAVAATAIGLAGCVPVHVDRVFDPVPTPPALDKVVVRYLGVGFHVRWGRDAVMTAPLYSNPNLLKESLSSIYPDQAAIARFHLAQLGSDDLRGVRAILVGHAHYDHLMDVPYLLQYSSDARILGNVTMKNVLDHYRIGTSSDRHFPRPIPQIDGDRLVALNDPSDDYLDSRNCAAMDPSPHARAGRGCRPYPGTAGRPFPVAPTIRVRAFCARHPRQLPPFHQAPGCQNAPLAELPRGTKDDYLEGEPLVFLVDFLDASAGQTRFRVYAQDVPSDGAFGTIPQDILDEHAVDLALLCGGNWANVEHHDAEKIICNLRPRHVLIGHWEDFFKQQDKGLQPAPFQNIGLFRRLVADRVREAGSNPAEVQVPAPGSVRVYDIGPRT